MRKYTQSALGFPLDHVLADELGFLDELLFWEEEGTDDSLIIELFEEIFGLRPEGLVRFEYGTEEGIQSLEGFEYDATYVLFEEETTESHPAEWKRMNTLLEENDIFATHGKWLEVENER